MTKVFSSRATSPGLMKLHTPLELGPEMVAIEASDGLEIMQLPSYTAYAYDQVGPARTCRSPRFLNLIWCEYVACQVTIYIHIYIANSPPQKSLYFYGRCAYTAEYSRDKIKVKTPSLSHYHSRRHSR